MRGPQSVVVIGGGIIGISCAIELLRDGHDVTLLELEQPGGPHQASFGNGAWFSPASVVPTSLPGAWRKVFGYLADPLGPLAIRWRYLPRLLPWLVRYLQAGSTVAKVEATARALRPLIADAPDRHRYLAEQAGVPHLVARQGAALCVPFPRGFRGGGARLAAAARQRCALAGTRRRRVAPAGTSPRSPIHFRGAGGGGRALPRPRRLCGSTCRVCGHPWPAAPARQRDQLADRVRPPPRRANDGWRNRRRPRRDRRRCAVCCPGRRRG